MNDLGGLLSDSRVGVTRHCMIDKGASGYAALTRQNRTFKREMD